MKECRLAEVVLRLKTCMCVSTSMSCGVCVCVGVCACGGPGELDGEFRSLTQPAPAQFTVFRKEGDEEAGGEVLIRVDRPPCGGGEDGHWDPQDGLPVVAVSPKAKDAEHNAITSDTSLPSPVVDQEEEGSATGEASSSPGGLDQETEPSTLMVVDAAPLPAAATRVPVPPVDEDPNVLAEQQL